MTSSHSRWMSWSLIAPSSWALTYPRDGGPPPLAITGDKPRRTWIDATRGIVTEAALRRMKPDALIVNTSRAGLFALSMLGLGVSIFPDIVPGAITIHEAAAPHSSLIFMLVGAGVLIPIILAYTGYAYWVFRGKIDPEEGYH